MKYLLIALITAFGFTTTYAEEPKEKPKMVLAKKKADKDKEAKEKKAKKSETAKK